MHNVTPILILLLVSICCMLGCRKVEFEEDETSLCRAYFNAAGHLGMMKVTFPIYKMGKLRADSPERESVVVFVEEKEDQSRIREHNLSTGKTRTLLKGLERIDAFDLNEVGDMAFEDSDGLYLLPAGEKEAIPTEYTGDIRQIKWGGADELFVQHTENGILRLDKEGSMEEEFTFSQPIEDFWVGGNHMLTGNRDSIVAYSVDGGDAIWRVDVSSYFGSSGSAFLGLAATFDHGGNLMGVFFSAREGIYYYNLSQDKVTLVWERFGCYEVSRGISTTDLGGEIVANISVLREGLKWEFGLLWVRPWVYEERFLIP